ncbi:MULTISPECIES: heme exporter protein CcmB [Thiorhodovibrio]|uniref:heme exporter protein CcmB n=1 Tax=Thiorhodovibrio TaxID=61593 RepID=UPI001912FB96|nr:MULTISPECIES: heme exporter protein CcmB [Thiorhodovibrio]MBK5968737.1 heme exporter protein CcmB [Thiorhodovibrio winogradskyi]WPL10907.1 Cytochrome c-type biogenesis protein CcmB [Thiorhodovibrio litoralis]
MLKTFWSILLRDLTLALRRRTDVLTVLFFFIIVVSLFPLGVGSEKALLRELGPGVVWVAALLASMLALERLFAADFDDGTLEQMLLTPQPLGLLVLAKVLAHWLLTGLPLVIIAPLIALQYQLEDGQTLMMMASLLLGTPTLGLIGAIGAALTLGLRGGGILLSLLILPLYIPILIYGEGAVTVSAIALADSEPYLMLLGALLLLSLILGPWAAAAALRISID